MRIAGITLRQLELGFDRLGPAADLPVWQHRRRYILVRSRHNKEPNCAVINPSRENRPLYTYRFFFPPLLNKLSDINQVKFYLSCLFMELGCRSSLFILERIFIAHKGRKKEAQQKRGRSYFKPVTFWLFTQC